MILLKSENDKALAARVGCCPGRNIEPKRLDWNLGVSGKAGVKSHHKIENDRGDDCSAKRCGDGLHDELTGTVGIAAGAQIFRDRVSDFHFFHVLTLMYRICT